MAEQHDFPAATGVRTEWSDVPLSVRLEAEARLEAGIVDAQTQHGGFSPGVAARLMLADGRRVFVKAVGSDRNPDTPGMHRSEARIVSQLPPHTPAPRLLFEIDQDDWVVLCFEDVDGSQPTLPWRTTDLARVLDAVAELSELMTPAPFEAPPLGGLLAGAFRGFRRLLEARQLGIDTLTDLDPWVAASLDTLAELESRWADASVGTTLLHCDLRADNILLTAERVMFVDWPHVAVGAPWFDLVAMLPSVAMQGGPDPQRLFTEHPLGARADPRDVDAVLCALAGYFVFRSRKDPPPGLPTLREFQRAQGTHATSWLRQRIEVQSVV